MEKESPELAERFRRPRGIVLSVGDVLLIYLSAFIVAYLGIGMSYNKFVKKRSGIKVFPHVKYWKALPGLVFDGSKYALSWAPCLRSSKAQQLDVAARMDLLTAAGEANNPELMPSDSSAFRVE